MSCFNSSAYTTVRNLDKVTYPEEKYDVVYQLNLPITQSAFPAIDDRRVRIMPLPVQQTIEVINPEFKINYGYGCTTCIRNRNVILSP